MRIMTSNKNISSTFKSLFQSFNLTVMVKSVYDVLYCYVVYCCIHLDDTRTILAECADRYSSFL